MNKKHLAAALAFSVIPGTVLADPSPEINYLMDHPASMLDMGLARLQGDILTYLNYNLTDLGLKSPISVNTTYDFARNQIVLMVSASEEVPSVKKTCGQLVMAVQTWMNAATEVWVQGFTHAGYTTDKQADAAVAAKLPGLVLIQGVVGPPITVTKTPMGPIAMCSGTLTSPGVAFSGP